MKKKPKKKPKKIATCPICESDVMSNEYVKSSGIYYCNTECFELFEELN